MRISKDPEVRRQEILDTAIKLFCTKGYEKTSISDIAKAMGVSQGLCYRYFASKEELYYATIDQYADYIVASNIKIFDGEGQSIAEQIRLMCEKFPAYMDAEKALPEMYELFHKSKNTEIHNQLYFSVCSKMVPYVKAALQSGIDNNEIELNDVDTTAYFAVYGQIGILRREDLSLEEKATRIQNFFLELLKLH